MSPRAISATSIIYSDGSGKYSSGSSCGWHRATVSKKFSSIDIDPIIELLTIYGEIVDTEGISGSICEDPNDNMFIECAIASNSKVIISGDKHLLKLSSYQEISVVKPRDFVEEFF